MSNNPTSKSPEKTKRSTPAYAFLVVSPDGEIQFAAGQSAEWLARFFGGPRHGTQLPKRVCRWLEAERKAAKVTSLVAKRKNARLFVRPFRPHPADAIPLLLEVHELNGRRVPSGHKGLSDRELEALRWTHAGKTNSEIGVLMGISASTVAKHIERIFQKLGVETRTAAASFYPLLAGEEGESVAAG